VGGGLDLCHFPARKVAWVKKCGFWSEIFRFFCSQIGSRSNHTHQSKKKGVENLPLKDSAWACVLGKEGAFLETLEARLLATT
jgi:hypothetical protein